MAMDCETLFAVRGEIVNKIEEANTAIDGAAEDLTAASMALAGAQGGAGLCLFLGPTPAGAACGAAALIAIAAAYAAVSFYQGVLEAATQARGEAQAALDEIDGLLTHCQALEPWQEEAREDLERSAPSPDSISIPDSDGSELSEAEDALAELEAIALDNSYA